ncbi:MAG TPA: transglycosylase domain-containing protein [Patescibacteria group bacterium]|nr:transglycosylase domain-containing protein [Patescibacteria group bacterium]
MLDYSRRLRRRRNKYFTLNIPGLPNFGRNFNKRLGLQNTPRAVLYSRLAKYAFFGLIGLIILMFVLFLWYGRDLPTPGKLIAAQTNQSSGIYDRNGALLYSVYQNQNRLYVNLADIPKYVKEGTISVEDRNFYTNSGFSITGYLRAALNIVLLRGLSGGSTLTQQLVKNVLLSSEQTIPRKIKELMLSIQVDRKYSKDQILEMYLNDVGYGGSAVGVQAASQLYFNKDVRDLDLAQSAFIAGLPQSPSVYSPFSGNKYYIQRTQVVLQAMARDGYITQKQADSALSEIKNAKFAENSIGIRAPHFVFYVKQQLINQFGEQVVESGGLRVKTTLDYNIESKAEQIVKTEIAGDKSLNVGNGAAMVTIPKTGEILAMIGSEDYFDTKNDGNFNAATAYRQPGSSLKPITYATAFARGYTAATLLMDTQTNFKAQDSEKDYIPVNYDSKYRGPIQVRFALANSINVPAVKMLAMVGIKNVMQNAYNMGIDNWQPTDANMANVGYSLVLGGRDVRLVDEMEAYGVFANGGEKMPLVSILEVDDAKGNVLYKYNPPSPQRIFSPEISFLISHILLDNTARSMEFGLYSQLVVPGYPSVSVKTGTTNDIRDNWTVGYTPSYAVGVWVGNNDNTPMSKVASGITGAAPIWNKIMSFVLKIKGKHDEPPQKPDNVIAMQIDALGGGLPKAGQPTRSEYFIKGTEPTGQSAIYQTLKLSKHQDGKLANASEIAAGDYNTKDFVVFKENDPISTDGKNRWQDGIDAWIKQTYAADHPEYYPPTDTSDYQENSNNPTETPTPTPTETPTPTTP